jgi:oligosaccharide repeat unit polymerase
LVGGALGAVSTTRRHRFISALTVTPSLLITITQTERNAIVTTLIFWASAFLATRIFFGKHTPLTWRMVFAATAVTTGLMFFSLLAVVLRSQTSLFDMDSLTLEVLPKLRVDVFGYLPVFSAWLANSVFIDQPPSFGALTFSGLFSVLGSHDRTNGLFETSVVLANGYESNIYTLFRELIEDYTLPGSVLILFLVGVVGGVAHRALRAARPFAVACVAAVYASTLFSFLSSVWTYNTLVAAFVIFGAVNLVALGSDRHGPASPDE